MLLVYFSITNEMWLSMDTVGQRSPSSFFRLISIWYFGVMIIHVLVTPWNKVAEVCLGPCQKHENSYSQTKIHLRFLMEFKSTTQIWVFKNQTSLFAIIRTLFLWEPQTSYAQWKPTMVLNLSQCSRQHSLTLCTGMHSAKWACCVFRTDAVVKSHDASWVRLARNASSSLHIIFIHFLMILHSETAVSRCVMTSTSVIGFICCSDPQFKKWA